MTTKTPHLQLDYLMPEQAQKHVTLNDALRRLDGLVQLSVVNRTTTEPPQAPQNGDRYLVAANSTDAWQGMDGQLALYEDTAWHFFAPQKGWRLWDEATSAFLVFNGTDWQGVASPASSEGGAVSNDGEQAIPLHKRRQAIITLGQANTPLNIPPRTIFLGVTAKVLDTLVGPTSWQLGVAGGLNRFGNGLPLDAGSTITGPADPSVIYWSETPLVMTPNGGNFTAGRIAMAIYYLRLPLPDIE